MRVIAKLEITVWHCPGKIYIYIYIERERERKIMRIVRLGCSLCSPIIIYAEKLCTFYDCMYILLFHLLTNFGEFGVRVYFSKINEKILYAGDRLGMP